MDVVAEDDEEEIWWNWEYVNRIDRVFYDPHRRLDVAAWNLDGVMRLHPLFLQEFDVAAWNVAEFLRGAQTACTT